MFGWKKQVLCLFSFLSATTSCVAMQSFPKNLCLEFRISRLLGLPLDEQTIWVNKGDACAMNDLGCCYAVGTGYVGKNRAEAARYFKMAANLGLPEAQHNYTICLLMGYGVPINLVEAAKRLEVTASNGDPVSQNALGCLFLEGIGVPKSPQTAFSWFERSAKQGFAVGLYSYGLCFLHGTGTEKNEVEAVKFLKAAAEQGLLWAQHEYGVCLQNGIGIEENKAGAVELFRAAAAQGLPEAQEALGQCFLHGWGVPEDKQAALSCFLVAAGKGNSSGQYHCAMLLADLGTRTECGVALAFCVLARAQNYPGATNLLSRLTRDVAGLDNNRRMMSPLLAAVGEEAKWLFDYANRFAYGIGRTQVNLPYAMAFCELACAKGYPGAEALRDKIHRAEVTGMGCEIMRGKVRLNANRWLTEAPLQSIDGGLD